jgi:hypothetical protein
MPQTARPAIGSPLRAASIWAGSPTIGAPASEPRPQAANSQLPSRISRANGASPGRALVFAAYWPRPMTSAFDSTQASNDIVSMPGCAAPNAFGSIEIEHFSPFFLIVTPGGAMAANWSQAATSFLIGSGLARPTFPIPRSGCPGSAYPIASPLGAPRRSRVVTPPGSGSAGSSPDFASASFHRPTALMTMRPVGC